MNTKLLIGLAIVVILLIGAVMFFNVKKQVAVDSGDTKVSPPKSESEPESGSAAWLVEVDEHTGVSFKYPKELSTTYIRVQNWPPQLRVLPWAFSCTTPLHTVDGHSYCVTTRSEGAAGSTYTEYTYAYAYKETTRLFTFSLRAVQCGAYDQPKRGECEGERASFNPDTMVDRMAQSVVSL